MMIDDRNPYPGGPRRQSGPPTNYYEYRRRLREHPSLERRNPPSHIREQRLEEALARAYQRFDALVIAARGLRRAQRNYIGRPEHTTEDERELLGQKVDAAARALDKAMEAAS